MIYISEIKMAGIKARKALKKYPKLKDNIDDIISEEIGTDRR